jgi:hypothetical protein
LRRKSRAYRFGPYKCSGTRHNLGSPVKEDVVHSDWHAKLRLVQVNGIEFGLEFTLKVGFKPSQPDCLQLGRLASKGAEKSFRAVRRRKRGLRKGKRRSRVRHTRRTALPATSSKTTLHGRAIQNKLRVLEWNTRVGNSFREELLQAHQMGKFLPGERVRRGFRKYESKWLRLHTCLLHGKPGSDMKLSADSALCHNFVSFVESRCRLYVRPARGLDTNASSFAALLQRADLPRNPLPLRKRPQGTVETGRGGGSLRARPGRIMCRGCGEQFIIRGEQCSVCYSKAHGFGLIFDRNAGVNSDAKKR